MADTVLLPEANSGVKGLHDKRNDVFQATHGDSFAPGGSHAGSGVSVGRNGVAVFEHGASYFVPILVHAGPVNDWTHIAVVYRNGEPSLYLNGRFVHKGLRSSKTVHGSLTSAGTDSKFAGKVSKAELLPRALDESDLAKLMGNAPGEEAGFSGWPIELTFNADDKLEVITRAPGNYMWKTAEGAVQKLEVASVPRPVEVKGPWEVSFRKNAEDRSQKSELNATFDKLVSWTERPEEWMKYYSGTAVYRKTYQMPNDDCRLPNSEKSAFGNRNSKIYLDLGEVRDIARVRVNGQDAGTAWKQPYRLDVTRLVKQGENMFEIEVVNTWLNRLIGDEQPGTQASTFTKVKSWKANTALLPAGLIGPVTIIGE